ncbi:conserved exported hypothetical protein [Gammaproteobacteria bacterium]
MKKSILLFLVLFVATNTAMAYGYGHGYRGGGWTWLLPSIIGGIIGYEVAQNQKPVEQKIIQQSTSFPQQAILKNCSPWTETQNIDGTITRTRTCEQ